MRTVAALACSVAVLSITLSSGCVDDGNEQTCEDECPQTGIFGCASTAENELVVCADFDDDPCLEWGGFIACDPDESCIDGDCVSGCDDECPADGQLMCDGDGFRECGEHDSDPCLEWSDVVSCPGGETCSSGTCASGCTDECAVGEETCDGGGRKTCGEHDSDSCRDWSPVEACGDGEICEGGDCVQVQCTEEGEDCVCGDNECCEGHCCPFLFICVSFSPDEDVCF
jgi:hypothetical protein